MRVAGDPPRARVFEVQRFSVHDGPGIRTTVFLSGCTLRCAWCHNPESFSGTSGRLLAPEEVLAEVLEDRDYYRGSGGGLTVSGGEPLIHRAFLRALLEQAKAEGLHTCVQTSGAVPAAALLEVLAWVDLFQFDLKHMDPDRHRALTGAGLEQIHPNAALLLSRAAKVEFRLPLVPGLNDDPQNLDRVSAFLAAHEVSAVRLVPYQRGYLGKYQQLGLSARCAGVEPPPPSAVAAVAQRFRRHGVTVAVDA